MPSLRMRVFLGLVDGGFVDEHDGDVVADGVDAAAVRALESILLRGQGDRRLAQGADEFFEEILGDHVSARLYFTPEGDARLR